MIFLFWLKPTPSATPATLGAEPTQATYRDFVNASDALESMRASAREDVIAEASTGASAQRRELIADAVARIVGRAQARTTAQPGHRFFRIRGSKR